MGEHWQPIDWFYLGGGLGFCIGVLMCFGVALIRRAFPDSPAGDEPKEPSEREDWR